MILCCPSNYVEIVGVSRSVYVCAGVEQHAHDFEVAIVGCEMQRSCPAPTLTNIQIRAVFDEEFNHCELVVPNGCVERAPAGALRCWIDSISESRSISSNLRTRATSPFAHASKNGDASSTSR